MIADHVKCNNCEKKLYVKPGVDACPACGVTGCLQWVNDSKQQADVPESKITK